MKDKLPAVDDETLITGCALVQYVLARAMHGEASVTSYAHGWSVAVARKLGYAIQLTYVGDPQCQPNANARLIASTPELYDALLALVRRSDNGDTIEPGWYEIEDARKALAKAVESV